MLNDEFKTLKTFDAGTGREGFFFSLPALEEQGIGKISRLPVSIRIVLESVLRNCDGQKVRRKDVEELHAALAVALGTRRHRLEGEPGGPGSAARSGDFRHGGVALLDTAPPAETPARAVLSTCFVLFCGGRARLHSGGDRFHSALRAVPGPSHVCVDRGHLPAHALKRRRQPVFAAMAAAG